MLYAEFGYFAPWITRTLIGSFRFECLSNFNVFLHFSNVYFYVESENNIGFLEKWIDKKLFNFKVIYSLCNTEETLTFIFPLFQGKLFHFSNVFLSVESELG